MQIFKKDVYEHVFFPVSQYHLVKLSYTLYFIDKNNGNLQIGHVTVTDGSKAEVDLVLIQTFQLYFLNQVVLMLTSNFQGQFP